MINGDDDDIFVDDAMAKIREHCTEDKLYIFQFIYGSTVVPMSHKIMLGNISTQCGVYKPYDLPEWPSFYGGDCTFYENLAKTREIEWVDKVIYRIKP